VLREGRRLARGGRALDLAESVPHAWVKQAKTDQDKGPPRRLIEASLKGTLEASDSRHAGMMGPLFRVAARTNQVSD
jgi:hypothetical protein